MQITLKPTLLNAVRDIAGIDYTPEELEDDALAAAVMPKLAAWDGSPTLPGMTRDEIVWTLAEAYHFNAGSRVLVQIATALESVGIDVDKALHDIHSQHMGKPWAA